MSTTSRLTGIAAVVGSAVLFASATVLVKFLTQKGISPLAIAFGRFALGTLVFGTWFALRGVRPRPVNWVTLLGRAVFNISAVLLFYTAIRYTTITKANVLNMTYPLFVAMLGPLILKEPTGRRQILALVCGLPGIWLVIAPHGQGLAGFNVGDLFGLACGIVSSVAILFLRRARAFDDSDTILLVVMVVGTVALAPLAGDVGRLGPVEAALWLGAAGCGVLGQLLITYGYRYVTAVDGSIASSSRIFFAGLLGVAIFGDPLTVQLVVGAVLILTGIYLVTTGRAGEGAEGPGA